MAGWGPTCRGAPSLRWPRDVGANFTAGQRESKRQSGGGPPLARGPGGAGTGGSCPGAAGAWPRSDGQALRGPHRLRWPPGLSPAPFTPCPFPLDFSDHHWPGLGRMARGSPFSPCGPEGQPRSVRVVPATRVAVPTWPSGRQLEGPQLWGLATTAAHHPRSGWQRVETDSVFLVPTREVPDPRPLDPGDAGRHTPVSSPPNTG